ncbi:MAG: fumarylacetoacetate hydrolase family protein [Flavobacteriaceae bacterium]|nr:fumarylacetoacetate hydrolase family protein [Flavobacteriaceae bacterium]|tara:strand:- start:231 stop:842 length:612 start_codon:yes stop_codon:yes gene_type:complete
MKIICIGRNYKDHIKELDNKLPEKPIFFLKPDSSILKNNKPFFIPNFSNRIEYEVEILIRINRIGKNIQKKFANKYYNEIGLGIDFTARDIQNSLKKKGLPWERAKAFDNSAVVGKWINKNHFSNIDDISFHLEKNGKVVQKGNTKNMIWKLNELISEVSKFLTLKIGDIIFSGTPSGVGKIYIDDQYEGFIENKNIFSFKIK